MSNQQDTPFRDFYDVMSFINRCNPARQKSINLIELETRAAPEDSSSLWALSVNTINYAIKAFPRYKASVFKLRYYAPFSLDASFCLSIEDIADKCMVAERTVHRWLAEMREECERLLMDRRLIPEKDENRTKRPE